MTQHVQAATDTAGAWSRQGNSVRARVPLGPSCFPSSHPADFTKRGNEGNEELQPQTSPLRPEQPAPVSPVLSMYPQPCVSDTTLHVY